MKKPDNGLSAGISSYAKEEVLIIMDAKKILVVDDEKNINDIIVSFLEKEGFKTCSALNGEQALKLLETENPDLILLDVLLPDINGVALCVEIRNRRNKTPILFLSCKDQETDKVIALSVGGDDYITKPFLPGELIARVKAHLRRLEAMQFDTPNEEIYSAPGLLVNVSTREVFVDNEPVNLTAKEFDLLHLFIKNPRRIYSPAQIFEYAWKTNSIEGDEKTVMVYVSTLRKKIENNRNSYKYIINVRGFGYKFNHQLLEETPGGKETRR